MGTMKHSTAVDKSYIGPVYKHIQEKITAALSPTVLQITNESHGRIQDESHFHVLVVAQKFAQVKSRIQCHRLVQDLFVDENKQLKFHSLRLTTKTPDQWEKNQHIANAPKCTGKGDGRSPTNTETLA